MARGSTATRSRPSLARSPGCGDAAEVVGGGLEAAGELLGAILGGLAEIF
jgi:hypothetical protein